MRQAASHRPAVANLVVRDVGDCRGKQRMCGGDRAIALDVAPARPGADTKPIRGRLDAVHVGDVAQVDQHGRRGQPEGEKRHQALATGDKLAAAIAGRQQRRRLGKRPRRGIFERREFHRLALLCRARVRPRHSSARQSD
jgi:hypothetical protein